MSTVTTNVEGADSSKRSASRMRGLRSTPGTSPVVASPYQEMIDALPMEHVVIVELDDADADVVGTPLEGHAGATSNARRLCTGHGCLCRRHA